MSKTERSATLVPAVGAQVERPVGRLPPERAEVGLFYRVPHLRVPFKFCGEEWVPVLGPKHRDADLGADWDHFHVDWRFATDRMLRESAGLRGSPHGTVISNDVDRWTAPHKIIGCPALKRRKCRRVMPDFPVRKEAKWVALEAAQRTRCDRLKDGHICPHRGIDLRPFEKDDGTAICPGHGLRWDLHTGELLARHEPPNVRVEAGARSNDAEAHDSRCASAPTKG